MPRTRRELFGFHSRGWCSPCRFRRLAGPRPSPAIMCQSLQVSNRSWGFRRCPWSRLHSTRPKLWLGSRGRITALLSPDMARFCLRQSPGSQLRSGAPFPFGQAPTSRAFHSHYHHSAERMRWERTFTRLGARRASFFDAELVLSSGGYDGNLKFTQEFAYMIETFFAVPLNFLTASREVFELSDGCAATRTCRDRSRHRACLMEVRQRAPAAQSPGHCCSGNIGCRATSRRCIGCIARARPNRTSKAGSNPWGRMVLPSLVISVALSGASNKSALSAGQMRSP